MARACERKPLKDVRRYDEGYRVCLIGYCPAECQPSISNTVVLCLSAPCCFTVSVSCARLIIARASSQNVLHVAALRGAVETLQFLIEAKANVNSMSKAKHTKAT